MRSAAEIRFRLRQEAANLWLWLRRPSLPSGDTAVRGDLLPAAGDIASLLQGTGPAADPEALAESICAHRFPLLGYTIETGPEIRWRRDYVHGVESGLEYFRRIPYLNAALAGDHKIVWELNRHQHLVTLAQAWLQSGRTRYPEEIAGQLESWWEQNPFQCGINWTSALEVAYRALSWIWIWRLAGPGLPAECGRRLLHELYRHGLHLEYNLSVYFAPNTHLLGEAVALHALGAFFPDWPRAARWKALGGPIVATEMRKQVREDGSHFEQSSAYHVYATDLFLFHALLEPVDRAYRERLRRMADYLAALSAEDGAIPFMGDDDGGRLFHPYGNRRRFGAATLATSCVYFGENRWPHRETDLAEQAVWWCGSRAFEKRPGKPANLPSQLFRDAGVAILSAGPTHIVADTRAFGHAHAGHSHAHALQFVCRRDGRDILIDPGTYTYVGEPEWRSRFRGTAYHNTVRVNGLDQARGAGPFRWLEKPATEVRRWKSTEEWCLLDAGCAYRGILHRRLLLHVREEDLIATVDIVTGDLPEAPQVEQFWHCGEAIESGSPGNYRIGGEALLVVPAESEIDVSEGGEYGWQSEIPGDKVPKPVLLTTRRSRLPALMVAVLFVRRHGEIVLQAHCEAEGVRLTRDGLQWIDLPWNSDPVVKGGW